MKNFLSKILVWLIAITFLSLQVTDTFARAGGGGGHSSGGHSSGGHSSGGGGGGGGVYFVPVGGGGGGGGSIDPMTAIVIVIVIILVLVVVMRLAKRFAPPKEIEASAVPFPEGLDEQKVKTAFLAVQDAWQKKDLKDIRKWISDGVYQRYNAQFAMMNKLGQVNKLSNIRIHAIRPTKTTPDGKYYVADVGISFSMDDEFISNQYPSFNESYKGDADVEYWTFIKSATAPSNKDLYNTPNCPNCSSPFKTEMGEICRCQNCGTLTNAATYDWVLSEITQDEDYSNAEGLETDPSLQESTKNDNTFAVQRMEDIASNVFMQTMQVLSGDKEQRLTRFADKDTIQSILSLRSDLGNFIFNRLYLNEVTLEDYDTNDNMLNLEFRIVANYQRVLSGQNLRLIDEEIMTRGFHLRFSKSLNALGTPAKETVYSYECHNCAAPYTDTTNDVCPYCGSLVVDTDHNWVLTQFRQG